MTNNEMIIQEIMDDLMKDNPYFDRNVIESAMSRLAKWKDSQPITNQAGWHTERPTDNSGYYLVDDDYGTYRAAQWDNDTENFIFTTKGFESVTMHCFKNFRRWKRISN